MGENRPVGFCDVCKKPLYEKDNYRIEYRTADFTEHPAVTGLPYPVCDACARAREEKRHRSEQKERKKQTVLRLWIGGLLSAAALIVGAVLAFREPLRTSPGTALTLVFTVLAGYLIFAFAFQIFNDDIEFLSDFFDIGFKSFRMPGVIFSLDPEGIFRLIAVKLFLAFLSAALSVLWFLLFFSLTVLLCGITFPFFLPKALSAYRSARK